MINFFLSVIIPIIFFFGTAGYVCFPFLCSSKLEPDFLPIPSLGCT